MVPRIRSEPYDYTYLKGKAEGLLWVEVATPQYSMRVKTLLELEQRLRRKVPFAFASLSEAEFRLHTGGRNSLSVRLLITPATLELGEAILRLQENGWGRGLEVAVIEI